MGIETIALSAAAALLKKPIERLLDAATAETKKQLLKLTSSSALEQLRSRINEVEKVRTIATKNPLSLRQLYYPARIKTSTGSVSIKSTNDLSDGANPHAVITGTVGQGKSVFLKYLYLTEADANDTIPIFIELRNINKISTLQELLKKQLNHLQLTTKANDDFLELAFKTRAVSLFFDGYDEIPRRP